MELVFGIVNIGIGVLLILIGFKFYNPFIGKNEPEKEELWYNKNGKLIKISGIIMLIWGIIKTISNLN